MKIQELRIGNLVKCKMSNDSAIYSVIQIDGFGLKVRLSHPRHTEFTPIDRIKPIPLTEEILLKCGFDFSENAYFSPIFNLVSKLRIVGHDGDFRLLLNTQMAIKVEYLHQLQNLFLDLTGEELEVKL